MTEHGQPGFDQADYGQGRYGRGAGLESERRGFDFTQIKTAVADRLHGAAHLLQEQAARNPSASEWGRLGQRAGDWFERSANYVNDLEPQQLRTDLENQVRRNPGRSLLVAGALGLVLGRLLRRR
jgi:ElaB/YqjD/DUF883 family membrane-anchored ribosome-binding protein